MIQNDSHATRSTASKKTQRELKENAKSQRLRDSVQFSPPGRLLWSYRPKEVEAQPLDMNSTWILHEFYMELRSYSRLHSCGVKSFSGTAFVCQYMLPNVHVRLKHVETSLHLGTCMYLMSTCNPNSRNWWLPRLVTKLQSKCRGQRKSSVPLWLHSWL